MAGEKTLPIRPTSRVRKAARMTIAYRAGRVWDCLADARKGVMEAGIHDMRVASKRLREALRMFRKAYRKPVIQRALDEVQRLNDSLGRVRDPDVLLEHLSRLPADTESELVDELRATLAAERAEHHARLCEVLDELEAEGFPSWLADASRTGRKDRRNAVAGQSVGAFACEAIQRRLGPFLEQHEAALADPTPEKLHLLRIANKKLRYAIEPFLGSYGRSFGKANDQVAQLQGTLGDLHDYDVLAQRIEAFARETGRLPQAAVLLECLRSVRAEHYESVLELIQRERIRKLVRWIQKAAQVDVEPPAKPEPEPVEPIEEPEEAPAAVAEPEARETVEEPIEEPEEAPAAVAEPVPDETVVESSPEPATEDMPATAPEPAAEPADPQPSTPEATPAMPPASADSGQDWPARRRSLGRRGLSPRSGSPAARRGRLGRRRRRRTRRGRR